MNHKLDPKLDLMLERMIEVPPKLVWECWTSEEHLPHWFVPKPWTVTHCKIDLRPGGAFDTTMRSPEGEEFPGRGCFLEVSPIQRLVWTDALEAGWRPTKEPFFTAILTLEPTPDGGTIYTAIAKHADPEACKKHEAMGFHDGWGTVLDQLVEYCLSAGGLGGGR